MLQPIVHRILAFFSALVFLSGCTFTFSGSVFVITISDLLIYIFVALLIAVLASLIKPEKRLTRFWITFVLGVLLTPLVSLIYLLITISKKVRVRKKQ